MEKKYYYLNDFEKVLYEGIHYTLPEKVIQIFHQIEKELNIHDISSSSTTSSSFRKNTTEIKKDQIETRDSKTWRTSVPFKITKIKSKEGFEKEINDVRVAINKLSNKNVISQQENIIEMLEKIIANNDEENIQKMSKLILQLMSMNKFYSELYTGVYINIIMKFPVFSKDLDNFTKTHKHSVDDIQYVDPNKDYDKYCEYIKINDNRRAMTAFLMNLYKNKIVEKENIIETLNYFFDKTMEYVDGENKTNEIEEITENIFIIISDFKNDEKILKRIHEISKMKIKEHKSLTNRVLFKYMDIIEKINK